MIRIWLAAPEYLPIVTFARASRESDKDQSDQKHDDENRDQVDEEREAAEAGRNARPLPLPSAF